MNEDIQAIAPETRTASTEGTRVQFRAYINSDGKKRLVWRIEQSVGNDAFLDGKESHVILPQGRQIILNDEKRQYLKVPRWMSDALVNDFEELAEREDVTIHKGDELLPDEEDGKDLGELLSGDDE